MVGVMAVVLFGFAGLAVDVGHVMAVRNALQASTDAAALAGAQLVGTGTAAQAIAAATSFSAVTGNSNAKASISATMASGYPMVKCFTSTGITCGGQSKGNAVVVQQQASVPTTFAGVLGIHALTVTTSATASASGGYEKPHDVMIVLDTTASMNNSDANCGIPGATRESCALAGVRTILSTLAPSQDQIGLMIFPGLTSAAAAAQEYDCSSGTPTKSQIAMYSAVPAPVYAITPLANDYRSSDAATTLNPGSDIVLASQGVASCAAGVSALGGAGTYYADVITAAQTVLATTGRANAQKVIIFLSDGDATADPSANPPQIVVNSTTKKECHAGITAAQAATAAGTWVYSVAYGSPTSGGCSYDSAAGSPITPCAAMQQVASSSTMFYSDNTTSCTSSANSLVGLLNAFQAISQSLLPPRLLPDNTT
jgi:hypothetical protein